MSSGYDRFFKSAQKAKQARSKISNDKKTAQKTKLAREQTAEEFLREALQVPKARSKPASNLFIPFVLVLIAATVSGLGYFFPEEMEVYLGRLEVSVYSLATAADGSNSAKASANNTATKALEPAGVAGGDASETKDTCPENKGFTEEELSHFNKLNERKKELDRREAELAALEAELHKQKSEIETRISKLEQVREDVAGVLKDRVEIDQQKVNTLVDFYSNMKPKQAADIVSKLNEDLAVEILGKMKKKNAADILNLLEPAKARVLSEKFTGYKRR